jgi:hypothetical protein
MDSIVSTAIMTHMVIIGLLMENEVVNVIASHLPNTLNYPVRDFL